MKKYELQPTDKRTLFGKPLFQVVALRNFGDVRKGDLGGYIESTGNLSHKGNCWVYNDAQVFGDSRVFGDARIFDDAQIFGEARVFENAWVYENARVLGNAWVSGDAEIYGTMELTGGFAFDTKNDHWDITEVGNGNNGNGTSTLYADAVFEPAEPECDVHDGSEVSAIREVCDHADWTRGSYSDGIYVDMGYRYCPKCGEKL